MSSLPYAGFRPSYKTCSEVSLFCPVAATTYGHYFTTGASAFFVALYSILFVVQLAFGIKGRTWVFTTFLLIGTIAELMGYAARLVMIPGGPGGSVWNYDAFVIQLVTLILGPTFVAAAISVTFKWIVIDCGDRYSVIKPKWYPWIFLGTDFFSIIIQAIGGGVSAGATGSTYNQQLLDVGSGLLIAGVAFQAVNMIFCGSLILVYMWRYIKAVKAGTLNTTSRFGKSGADRSQDVSPTPTISPDSPPQTTFYGPNARTWDIVKPNSGFRLFLWALAAAYIAIIARCIHRIPEMAEGWGSELMQDESLFLIFDGGAIGFAVLVLVIFHPTYWFPVLRKGSKSQKKIASKANEKDKAAVGTMNV